MNIEELSKSQILLLAILVSFVTAIATGILTVSMLTQASPTVSQTINRVVERTVERVVPNEDGTGETTIATRETTVVVNEQDLITDAIAKIDRSLVNVVLKSDLERSGATPILGIVVGSSGHIVVEAGKVNSRGTYVIDAGNDISFELEFVKSEGDFAILKTTSGTLIEGTAPVTFAGASSLRLGQSVVAISGGNASRVATGIIASFPQEEGENRPFIDATVAASGESSPLVNIFGEIVGMSTASSRGQGNTVYRSASAIQAAVTGL